MISPAVCSKYVTRVRILPTGVESKKSIGDLNMASVKPEKNAFEALSPIRAAMKDLIYTKTVLNPEIPEYTAIKMPLPISSTRIA